MLALLCVLATTMVVHAAFGVLATGGGAQRVVEAVRLVTAVVGAVCAAEIVRGGVWLQLMAILLVCAAFMLGESWMKRSSRFCSWVTAVALLCPGVRRRQAEKAHSESSGEMQEDYRSILDGARSITQSSVAAVMIPRGEVFFIDVDARCDEARAEMTAIGFSRAFACEGGGLDGAVGIVHVKDLRDDDVSVRDVMRPVTTISERTKVLVAIRTMQRERSQLALVASEYGEIRGLVAMEDLLEELVGEIYDESDDGESAQWEDGCLTAAGRTTLASLRRDGVELGASRAHTLTGFVQERLGRMAVAGDVVRDGEFVVEVLGVKGLTVDTAAVRRVSEES